MLHFLSLFSLFTRWRKSVSYLSSSVLHVASVQSSKQGLGPSSFSGFAALNQREESSEVLEGWDAHYHRDSGLERRYLHFRAQPLDSEVMGGVFSDLFWVGPWASSAPLRRRQDRQDPGRCGDRGSGLLGPFRGSGGSFFLAFWGWACDPRWDGM